MIPAGLAPRLSAREMEQILLHELAHVARYDDWTIAAQRLIEAAAIFHPLVRYVGYRLNLDREMACDDRVAQIGDRGRYAECLAKVAQMNVFTAASAVLAPLLERKSELLARIEVLLDNTRTHVPQISRSRLFMASAAFILLGIAGLRAPGLIAMPAPPAVRSESTPSEQSQPSIYSIVVTSKDGSRSIFGSWSSFPYDDGTRTPRTIEFRSGDKSYIVRDKGIFAQAEKILEPMQELGRRQSQLGERQSMLGELQSNLGDQQQKVTERRLDSSARAELSQKLQALKAQFDELNAKHLGETAGDVQAQLANLQATLAELQARMSSIQGQLGEAQGRLDQQQGELGEQQAQLGTQQAELGKQQARESQRAEEKLRDLIRNAQVGGLVEQSQ
jgi:hypothetical protein